MVVPLLLLAASLCAVFLIYGAWHPKAEIADSIGHLCVALSFLPGIIAIGLNLYAWQQHSFGIRESIGEIFESIKPF
jgi:hypothetical protein